MPTKKDQLLGKSRALIGGRKIASLSDFQATPTENAVPEKNTRGEETGIATQSPEVAMTSNDALSPDIHTTTYTEVQRRTKAAVKVARENFRFTEELATALENCASEKRLKKNTVVEIALEHYLKQEGYL